MQGKAAGIILNKKTTNNSNFIHVVIWNII